MNKALIVIGVFMALVLCSTAKAASKDYKCYVDYIGGSDGIKFVKSERNDLTLFSKLLKSEKVKIVNRGKKAWINKVYECVLETEQFKLGRAQTLDRTTPR